MAKPFEGKDKILHSVTDTDLSHTSPHHTLGAGPTQAARGNHKHTLAEITDYDPTAVDQRYVLTTGDEMTGALEFNGPRHTTGVRFHETGALATDHRFIGLRTGSTGIIGLGTYKPVDDPVSPLALTPFAVAAPALPEHAVSLGYLNAGRQVTITPTPPFADYAAAYAGIWATGVGAMTTIEGLLKVSVSTAITAGTSYPVLTVPSGWRPDHDVIFTSLLAPAGGATFAPVRMTIVAATGVMSMISPTAQTYSTIGWMPVGCTYRSTS